MNPIDELVARTFCARNLAHLHHFQTQSLAEHMALDEFYHDVIAAVDKIVEGYQGRFSLIALSGFPAHEKFEDSVKYFGGELRWIEQNKSAIDRGNAAIGNQVDELAGVYNKLIYKLRNLR
jgi:hypothetical protein